MLFGRSRGRAVGKDRQDAGMTPKDLLWMSAHMGGGDLAWEISSLPSVLDLSEQKKVCCRAWWTVLISCLPHAHLLLQPLN